MLSGEASPERAPSEFCLSGLPAMVMMEYSVRSGLPPPAPRAGYSPGLCGAFRLEGDVCALLRSIDVPVLGRQIERSVCVYIPGTT
jgi:hypothetical protein